MGIQGAGSERASHRLNQHPVLSKQNGRSGVGLELTIDLSITLEGISREDPQWKKNLA